MLLSQSPTLLSLNYLILSVAFICNQNFGYIAICMLINLLQPVRYVIEGLLICCIINKYYAHCSLVVGLGDGAETLLTSCVPYLELYALIINVDFLDLEINT